MLIIPAELQYNGTVVECLAVFLDGTPTERTPIATILFTTTNLPTVTTTSSPTTSPTIESGITPSILFGKEVDNNNLIIGGFDLVPSPLTVAVEQETATFQCQHSLADDITWLLNGTSLNRTGLPNVFFSVRFKGSVRTYTLSIGTLVEYNQTKVECVALFIESPLQKSEAVVLLIQGRLIDYCISSKSCYGEILFQDPIWCGDNSRVASTEIGTHARAQLQIL